MPDGREEGVAAADDLVHVEELVQVEEETGEVGHEEHADHADQDEGQLEVFGLEGKGDSITSFRRGRQRFPTKAGGVTAPIFRRTMSDLVRGRRKL